MRMSRTGDALHNPKIYRARRWRSDYGRLEDLELLEPLWTDLDCVINTKRTEIGTQ